MKKVMGEKRTTGVGVFTYSYSLYDFHIYALFHCGSKLLPILSIR